MNSETQNCVNLGNQKHQPLLQLTLLEYKHFCHLLKYIPHQDGIPLNKNILKLKTRILFSSAYAMWLFWAHAIQDFCDLFLEKNSKEWNNHSLLLWNNSHWLISAPCGNYRWVDESRIYGHIKKRQPGHAWQQLMLGGSPAF